MALPPQNNEAFLREVDEELRRDQLLSVWRSYGRWIVGAVVVALAGFAGWLYWGHRQTGDAAQQGMAFRAVVTDLGANNFRAAEPKLKDIAASDIRGYRAMGRFTQGDILLLRNDLKGAAKLFGQIAGDEALDQPYRDLALVRQTSAEYDTLTPQQVVDRLSKLATKDSAFFGSAGEMVAAAYLRQGKQAEAGRLYGEIAKSDAVPQSLRQRSVQLAGALGVDAVQTEEKKAQ